VLDIVNMLLYLLLQRPWEVNIIMCLFYRWENGGIGK
jgi:hypothetical protein